MLEKEVFDYFALMNGPVKLCEMVKLLCAAA